MTIQYQTVNTSTPNSGAGTPLRDAFTIVNQNFSNLVTPVPFANLGTAAAGYRAFVSDGNITAASNFGSQISGGGANVVPVWSDGTHWYVG